MRRILEGLKTGMRVDYELKWTKLTPVLRNDKPTMARVLNVAREMLGPANVIEMPAPSMGSEDYAWFAERVPSAHLRIGSKIDGHETAIHRTDYQLNEQMIPLGDQAHDPRGAGVCCASPSAWPALLRAPSLRRKCPAAFRRRRAALSS